MRHRRSFALALCSAIAASSPVDAQDWWSTPKVYCPMGSLSCMGAYFNFTPHSSGYGTTFTAYVQNLQGSYTADPGPTTMRAFVLSRANKLPSAGGTYGFYNAIGVTVSTVGNVQRNASGSVLYNQSITYDHPYGTTSMSWYGWDIGQGLAGCNGNQSALPDGRIYYGFDYRTCPTQGLNGWLQLDFHVATLDYATGFRSPLTTFSDFAFTIGLQQWPDGGIPDGPSEYCSFGDFGTGMPANGTNCGVFAYPSAITPEPGTLSLFALGAAGLAGWRRRRRRSDERRTA